MPLRDILFPKDPLVQSGVISRADNWRMRLGSLAAALGEMDRGGQLGQALARGGALYQSQRQGVLADAFEQSREAQKAQREEELFQMQREKYEREREDAEAEKERLRQEEYVKTEQEITAREADRRWLQERDYPMQYADSPETMKAIRTEHEARLKEKPDEPKTIGGQGGIWTIPPGGGQPTFTKQPTTLTPQEEWLRRNGYDPFDPAAKERYLRDQGLTNAKGDSLTTQGKLTLVTNMATQLVKDSVDPNDPNGEPTLSYGEALDKAKQTVDGLVKSFEMDKAPKPLQGKTVAGVEIPKPGSSSPATGKMKIVSTPGHGKLDGSDQVALLKIQEAIQSIPDQKTRAQAMALAMRENQQGKSWATLWAEMNAQ